MLNLRRLPIFLYMLSYWAPLDVQSQPYNTDSLKSLLAIEKQDSNKIKLLVQIASEYRNHNATPYLDQALKLAEKQPDKSWKRWTLNQYPRVYAGFNLPKALEYAFIAAHYAEQIKDTAGLLEDYFTFITIYIQLRDPDRILAYARKSEVLVEKAQLSPPKRTTYLRRNVINARATAYTFLGRMDSARHFRRIGYEMALQSKSNTIILISLAGMGATFVDESPDSAIYYFRRAIPLAEKDDRGDLLSRMYSDLARIAYKRNNRDSAVYFAKLALDYGHRYFQRREEMEAATLLHQLYAVHQPDSAYTYLLRSAGLKDSIFGENQIKAIQQINYNERQRIEKAAQEKLDAQTRAATNAKLLLLLVVLAALLLIVVFLFKNNKQKQKANRLLHRQKEEIEHRKKQVEETLAQLRQTQSQLIHAEKMASLGELTAGIAHEIQNPLNFVNNFAEINTELVSELKEEAQAGNTAAVLAVADDLHNNLQKITHHGNRADAIVKGMLQHSRKSTGKKEPTDINVLAAEYVRLSYHGLRTKDKTFQASIQTRFDEGIGPFEMIPQDIGRVLLNLLNNSFYAVNEKQKQQGVESNYTPTVTVSTQRRNGAAIISIADNGTGIPEKTLEKIYQPFFTTKPAGEGTGLGLSLSYDIITKGHGGEMKVESKEGEYTIFTISLPLQQQL